jgi:hypothetical protein
MTPLKEEVCAWCERTFIPEDGTYRCSHCNTVIPSADFEILAIKSLKKLGPARLTGEEMRTVIRLDVPPLRDFIVDRWVMGKPTLSLPSKYIGRRAVLYIFPGEREPDEVAIRGETE